jgi:hypothetical protein
MSINELHNGNCRLLQHGLFMRQLELQKNFFFFKQTLFVRRTVAVNLLFLKFLTRHCTQSPGCGRRETIQRTKSLQHADHCFSILKPPVGSNGAFSLPHRLRVLSELMHQLRSERLAWKVVIIFLLF